MCRSANALSLKGNVHRLQTELCRMCDDTARLVIIRGGTPSREADEYRDAVYNVFFGDWSEISPGDLRRRLICEKMLNGDLRSHTLEHYCYGGCCAGGRPEVTRELFRKHVVKSLAHLGKCADWFNFDFRALFLSLAARDPIL